VLLAFGIGRKLQVFNFSVINDELKEIFFSLDYFSSRLHCRLNQGLKQLKIFL